jgi:flagellar biosynthesis/type III secretory pathway protein FliH
MRDLSSTSLPFTFNDFARARDEGAKPKFVSLFPKVEKEGQNDVKKELSAEDQARQVFEDAYVQGEKAGFEMGMRRVESIAKRLEKQIQEVVSFKTELRGRYETLSTELALIFAEAIVLRECSEKKEVLGAMIRKALEACEERGGIVIRVRGEDAGYIEALASEHLEIVKDEFLKEPGFVVETRLGDIDGRLSTQIQELRASLTGYHGE